MKTKCKRLLSLLLVFVLVLGLMPSVYAATDGVTQPTTEPAATEATTEPTGETEPTVPETSEGAESTDPPETTEATEATETETEPTDESDEDWTQPPEDDGISLEEWDQLRFDALSSDLPAPIEEYFPYDPSIQYPYGIPVENYYPSEVLGENPFGVAMFAADDYGIATAADMSAIPENMYDNAILRALEYTGYDVQWLKDNGYLYVAQYVSSNINSSNPDVLSDIGYDDYSPFLNGDETVADSSTKTGKAPDIAKFEENGLVCASFVTYFISNYLPNIEGIDTTHIHEAIKATTMNGGSYSTASVWSWSTGLNNLANTAGSGVTKYTDATTAYANLVPGDIIIFSKSDGSLAHAAIYAGTYDFYNTSGTNRGKYHFIIHVGNSRGPEISTVEYMGQGSSSKTSTPSAWYHLDVNDIVNETGFIEVYKEDPNGNDLSGAKFKAVDQTTGDVFYIGPTNASGYAKSGELPFGTYKVTETVFPTGYGPSGTTEWTVTIDKNTPNNTITITAVNEKITGGLTIQKATNTGNNLDGWTFGVYTDAACTKPISGSPFTTPANGKIVITGLEPGTYYVKETSSGIDYWITDNGVKTVKVTDSSNETVYITNTNYGYGKIIKKTNTGSSLSGWKFNVYTDEDLTTTVSGSPFTTDEDGLIVMDLLPGTYYVQEVDESDKYPDWAFDTTVRTLKVEVGTTKSVTFTNNQAGYAEIVKKTNTGGSLGGWKFNVYTDVDCTKLVGGSPFTTDTDGVITVKVAPGTYYVKEVDESDKYPLWDFDTTTRKVVVRAGETGSVTFTNTHYGYGQIIKKTNTGGTLDGWKFNIYTDEACTKLVSGSPFTTDSQGLIAARLLPGTYWVKEVDESSKRPDWEFDTATRKLTVTAGNTSSVTFNNKHFGYAQIVKETSTGEDLGGWKFNIYADEACTTLIDGSPFTSGDDGTIKVKLAPGTYWVQEIDESDENPDWNYDTTIRKVTVSAGDVAKVTFTNTHFGYAEIQKTTNTGKDLGGWKFDIFTDADCTQKVTGSPFTTDEAGKMSVRLLPGTYFVQEVDESAANPDWIYDTKVHVVTVKAGETVSVKLENQQMGRVKLIKAMPDGGPVSGWVFDIYRKSDNVHMGTFTSGEDGTIISDWFLPGEYLVYEQLDEQSVYWCESENPQEVTIKAGETAEVTFTNRLKPGKISIQKVDITGEPLAGAEFLLEWSVDGANWHPVSHTDSQYVTEGTCTSAGLKDGKLVSDETGLVEFTGLHPERLYRLTETAAPEGYQLLADTAYEGGLPADTELTIQLTVVNVPTFELPKTGSKSMLLMPISLALAAALCGAILVIGKRKAR